MKRDNRIRVTRRTGAVVLMTVCGGLWAANGWTAKSRETRRTPVICRTFTGAQDWLPQEVRDAAKHAFRVAERAGHGALNGRARRPVEWTNGRSVLKIDATAGDIRIAFRQASASGTAAYLVDRVAGQPVLRYVRLNARNGPQTVWADLSPTDRDVRTFEKTDGVAEHRRAKQGQAIRPNLSVTERGVRIEDGAILMVGFDTKGGVNEATFVPADACGLSAVPSRAGARDRVVPFTARMQRRQGPVAPEKLRDRRRPFGFGGVWPKHTPEPPTLEDLRAAVAYANAIAHAWPPQDSPTNYRFTRIRQQILQPFADFLQP